MKTPEQIASRRATLEQELEKLDNEEQAWSELTRPQLIAELIHEIGCNKDHGDYNGYCKFHLGSWKDPNWDMEIWSRRSGNLLKAVPEDLDDETIVKIYKAART